MLDYRRAEGFGRAFHQLCETWKLSVADMEEMCEILPCTFTQVMQVHVAFLLNPMDCTYAMFFCIWGFLLE